MELKTSLGAALQTLLPVPCSPATVSHFNIQQTAHSAETQNPHRYFHVDVIKRDKRQNILLDTNNFSTKISALQVKSDIANDLSDGLIILRSSMRHP